MSVSIFDGIVTIQLDGESVELKPSVGAGIQLSGKYSGLLLIIPRLRNVDMGAMADIVHAAMEGRYTLQQAQELVYRTGAAELVVPLIEYVDFLAHPNGKNHQSRDASAGKP